MGYVLAIPPVPPFAPLSLSPLYFSVQCQSEKSGGPKHINVSPDKLTYMIKGRDGTPNLITFCAHDLFRAKDFRSFYLLCKLKRKSIFIICRYLDFGDFSLLFCCCCWIFGMAAAPSRGCMWTGGFVWIIMHFTERIVFIRVCRMDSCNKNII